MFDDKIHTFKHLLFNVKLGMNFSPQLCDLIWLALRFPEFVFLHCIIYGVEHLFVSFIIVHDIKCYLLTLPNMN